MNRVFTVILLIAAIVSLVSTVFNLKKVSAMEDELNKLRGEKITLMQEHEECLTYKEQSLKKELMTKYLDSIVILMNKIDAGHTPTKEETANFYDRIDFIANNIGTAAVSKEETNLVLTFIDSAKKTFETKIKPQPEKDGK